jgi:hypothetical protein
MPRFHRPNLPILFLGSLFILTTLYFTFARSNSDNKIMDQTPETPKIDPQIYVGSYFAENKNDEKYGVFLAENKKVATQI